MATGKVFEGKPQLENLYVRRCCVLVAVAGSLAVFSGEMRVSLSDPLEWLYPDSLIAQVRSCVETDVPANGVAEVNVLFNGVEPGKPLSFASDAADGEWFRMVDVPVDQNTGPDGAVERPGVTNEFVTRDAPFRVYDALEPLTGGTIVPSASTVALRFRLRAFSACSGSQDIALTFSQGGSRAVLPFRVNVYAVEVQPVGRGSFRYTNWMNYNSMAACHGLKPWSPAHLQMIERYARLAVYGRQNMAPLPLLTLADGSLDEGKYVQLVEIMDRVGIAYLEGPHLCRFSTGKWGAPAFTPRGSTNLTSTAQGAADLAKLAAAFATMIERNGWRGRWYQHVADEPSEANVLQYRITCGIVRKYMPGILLSDAIELSDLAGALDVYCPKNYKYEESRPQYEALRTRPTDEIWCYTCMFPGGRWMNRLLDNEILRPVLLPWGCRKFGLDGYLHWGYNQFSPANDPLRKSGTYDAHMGDGLPPGDRNIVYAGSDGPWPSVRLEAMRQGFEDLELLGMLARRDKTAADALISRVVRGFGDYTTGPAVYRAARRDLLAAVSTSGTSK